MQGERNFCSHSLCDYIVSSAVSVDGCEASNLLADSNSSVRAANDGFICAGFIRPPVSLTLQFCCPVNISAVTLVLRCGRQLTTGVQLSVSSEPFTSEQSPPSSHSWQRIGCYTLHEHLPNERPLDILTFATRCWQQKNCDKNVFRYLPAASRRSIRCLQVKLTRALGPSAVCLRRLEVLAQPVNRRHPGLQRALEKLSSQSKYPQSPASDDIGDISDSSKTSPPTITRGNSGSSRSTDDAVSGKLGVSADDIPEIMIDPITFELMLLPVVLPCGKTIDRETLEKHVRSLEERGLEPADPFTGLPFSRHCQPQPNTLLQARIDQFLFENAANTRAASGEQQRQLAARGRVLGRAHSDSKSGNSITKNTRVMNTHRSSGGRFDKIAESSAGSVSCSSEQAPTDLDSCLRTALSDLVSFCPDVNNHTVGQHPPSPISCPLHSRNGTASTTLYRLPCEHILCRRCLIGKVRSCATCGLTFSSCDVVLLHS